jgi:hypothetical protein
LLDARRLAKSEAQGQFLLAAPVQLGTLEGFPIPPATVRGEQSSPAPHAIHPRLSEWLGPGLPNRRREFDSRTVVSETSGR